MIIICVVFFYINRELWCLVLFWVEYYIYELCYCVSCCNGEEYFEFMYDNQKLLLVQGLIFVCGWDLCKDILFVFGCFIFDDLLVGWNKSYVNGEKFRNVQYIVFGKVFMCNYIGL